MPFRDASADIILLSNVLEHTPEPSFLLSECLRVLKPSGVLLGSVPFLINVHQRPYDFYRYTDINLNYLFRKNDFKVAKIKAVALPHVLLFNAMTVFFVSFIQKTSFSKNKYLQKFYVIGLRVIWKLVRFSFRIFSPVLRKCYPDEDAPLGYLFKVYK